MARDYSDLEVAAETSLPEPVQADKIFYQDAPKEVAVAKTNVAPPRRICGLPPKRFWILLCGIILIVAAAAIGGGVGATEAAKSKKSGNGTNSKSLSSSSQPTATPTSTTNTPPTLTTSTQIGPTQTLYRDCPSSNNTIFKGLGSNDYQFRKFCNASFHWAGGDVINARAGSLNECINMCAAYNINNASAIADRKSSICNGVCWRNSIKDPDWPGQCFGSTFQNSSDSGFPMAPETICDSAAWINQHFPV